jgi:hypothetical protein
MLVSSEMRGAWRPLFGRRVLLLCIVLLGSACTTPLHRESAAPGAVALPWDAAVAERILALDPDRISERDVRMTLAAGPTPRMILLHGGVYPSFLMMSSFATFLEGMGYPSDKLRDPADRSYSQSPYGSSERLAGEVAWYYEHDGVHPMLIGQSLGGMQAVKVLYELQGAFNDKIAVWDPYGDRAEARYSIVDPLSGLPRPVIGVSVSLASEVGAGGVAFVVPTQWNMLDRLRAIPDTVDEFLGFTIIGDPIAFTFSSAAGASHNRANGAATVRNVTLPLGYNHVTVPVTHGLAQDPRARAWINDYVPNPAGEPRDPAGVDGANIVWAAEVWFSIKKHWCLEAQHLIRARQTAQHKSDPPPPSSASSVTLL